MKFRIFLLIPIIFVLHAHGQKNFFVYVQTENKQAFSVRLNNQIYSSTDYGYLIIPQLVGGDYTFLIDFPKKGLETQKIDFNLNYQDMGFLLKTNDSGVWGLQNLQTGNFIAANMNATGPKVIVKSNDDLFSNMLAEATNTPSVRETRIVADSTENQEKENTTKDPVDQTAIKNTDAPALPVVPTPIEPKTEDNKIVAKSDKDIQKITRIFSAEDTTGYSLIYISEEENAADTIVAFIPYDDMDKELLQKNSRKKTKKRSGNRDAVEKNETAIDTASEKDKTNAATPAPAKDSAVYSVVLKNDADQVKKGCNNEATEKDFLQLRRKMAEQESEEKMLSVARKVFKTKCFTVSQLKNLAFLLIIEDNRYLFLEAGYSAVTDRQNFQTLQILLADEANVSRFKELIK